MKYVKEDIDDSEPIRERLESPVMFEVQTEDPYQALISDFYVPESERSKGHASNALREIESKLKDVYGDEFEILVRIGTDGPVVRFLQKHNYNVIKEEPKTVAKKQVY